MRQPCPSCPDGNEWNSNGPTGRACRTCKGKAYVQKECEHDLEHVEDFNGNLAEGGGYAIYRCRICETLVTAQAGG